MPHTKILAPFGLGMTRLTCVIRWLQPFALLAAAAFAAPAQSDVDLRVEARPLTDPIDAFVRVTNQAGVPVAGLDSGDFAVTLDGLALSTSTITFALPPDQDPAQGVSIIFVMDYSGSVTDIALDAMQDAVIAFIDQMEPGDRAAILKFTAVTGPSIVQPFTAIDDGGLGDEALKGAVMAPFEGSGTNLLDALNLAVDTFLNPGIALPMGPKAIIVISDGIENSSELSQSEVVAHASNNSLPVFTIGVGEAATDPAGGELLLSLAENTGGDYVFAPDEQGIADAYATVAESLNNEYKLSIPTIEVQDCDRHTLEVTVQGETASAMFTRCDATPDDFKFIDVTGVERSTVVTSDVATIVGLDTPVPISVTGGEYSIGCGATFTTVRGTIGFGDTVCVRQTSSANFSSDITTVLIVGGVSGAFTSTTRAEPPPTNGGGGGGAAGIVELLLGLGALFGRRRRRT